MSELEEEIRGLEKEFADKLGDLVDGREDEIMNLPFGRTLYSEHHKTISVLCTIKTSVDHERSS